MTPVGVSALARITVLAVLVAACNGGISTSVPATGSDEPPSNGTPQVSEPPSDGPGPGDSTSEKPPTDEPPGGSGNAFTEPAEDSFLDKPAYSSRASFGVEGVRRAVVVTVYGANAESVKAYTDEAVFSFEIQDTPAPLAEETIEGSDAEPDEEAPSELAPERLLEQPDSQNLFIEFRLTDRAAEGMITGQLIATIDPTIPGGAYHNFYMRDPSSDLGDTVDVELTVAAGEAAAYLYRNCELAAFSRRSAGSLPGRLKGSGPGRFDFVVAGRDSPSSTYRLRGSWYYSYSATMPSSTTAQVSC